MLINQDAFHENIALQILGFGPKSGHHHIMKIIPVIDVLGGKAVHARGGNRSQYQALMSVVTPLANDPEELAGAYLTKLGLEIVYLADLDSILENQPDVGLYERIVKRGLKLWVDAGTQTAERAISLREAGVDRLILGLESLEGPENLCQIVRDSRTSADQFMVSLDCRDGKLLFPETNHWPESTTMLDVVKVAYHIGVKSFIMLDLGRVGTGLGTTGGDELAKIVAEIPGLEIWLGGGVSGVKDLQEIASLPVKGVLVGTAIHDGRIGIHEINMFRKGSTEDC